MTTHLIPVKFGQDGQHRDRLQAVTAEAREEAVERRRDHDQHDRDDHDRRYDQNDNFLAAPLLFHATSFGARFPRAPQPAAPTLHPPGRGAR